MIRRSAQSGLSRSLSPLMGASSRAACWLTPLVGGCRTSIIRRILGATRSAAGSGPSNTTSRTNDSINKSYRSLICTPVGVDEFLCSATKAPQAPSIRLFSPPRWMSSSKSSSSSHGGKKKRKSAAAAAAATDSTSRSDNDNGGGDGSTKAASQHEEWVAFQRTIAVQGFETGQQTQVASRARRGGRLVRKKQQKLRERDEDDPSDPRRFTDLAGGEFPPFRYSQEETERLLAQAYANLPERAGRRGTRNLKRQGRRWFLVRKVRELYKHHMANFQVRKMAKRSEKVRLVKQVLEGAPDVRLADRQYQAQVFAKWSSRMDQQRRIGATGADSV